MVQVRQQPELKGLADAVLPSNPDWPAEQA
jgi:hypothetical protein